MNKYKKYKNDILLGILYVCIIVAVQVVLVIGFGKQGKQVTVTCDGALIGTYSLQEDYSIPIRTEYGYNMLIIKNNEAFISESDCDNNDCVRTGRISKQGETIVCIPHKIIISVISESESEEYDSFVY